ncbi:MAG TPA: hypothetical protein VKT78_15850, partial [Fimbriimonadaceae bacterium]|nr:hypothetical protein [Fimbriimonadaceae bacterium]
MTSLRQLLIVGIVLASNAALAQGAAGGGAPATPPPSGTQLQAAPSIPLSDLTVTQLQGELKKVHEQEALFNKRAANLTKSKVPNKTLDGFTLDQVNT